MTSIVQKVKKAASEALGFEFVDIQDMAKSSSSKVSNEENKLGQRVELKWSSGRWYKGTICDYNQESKEHFVVYDDGDKKWYKLPEMVFKFIEEEDEWIEVPKEEGKERVEV